MRFCRQCGQELVEGKKFCTKCGTPVITEPTKTPEEQAPAADEMPEVPKKKSGMAKWKIVLGSILLVIVLAAIIFGMIYFSDENRLKRSIEAGQWSAVEEIYTTMSSKGQEEKAKQTLINSAETVKDQYIRKEITKEAAFTYLDKLNGLEASLAEIELVRQYITELEASRNAYDLAETYWNEEDYENAILQYRLVIVEDENYTDAEAKLKEGTQLYKDKVTAELDKLMEDESYETALQKITMAESILGEDADLTILKTKCEKAGLVKSLDTFEKEQNYAAAIELMEAYSSVVEENPDLQTRKDLLIGLYRNTLFSEAKAAYRASGYEAAVGKLTTGFQILPDDADIQTKIEEYKACAPVRLETLKVISTNSTYYLDNKYKDKTIDDIYGNQYQGYFELWSKGNMPRVELFTDGKYSNFRGTFFVSSNSNEEHYIEYRIYADEVLVYRSGYINRKEKAIDFDISINYAETITIEGYSTDGNSVYGPILILTNAEVYNVLKETPDISENGEKAEIPNLLGMSYTEAKAALSELGMGIRLDETLPSEDYKIGQIIAQDIEAGEMVGVGSTVAVDVCGS